MMTDEELRDKLADEHLETMRSDSVCLEAKDGFKAGWNAARANAEQERVGAMTIELHRVMKDRDEWIANYRAIELANKEMSRVDHLTVGELYQERDSLKAEVERLKAELTDERKANYADDFNYQHEKAKELRAEVERLRAESIEMLTVAGHEHITRTMAQAEKRMLTDKLARARSALEWCLANMQPPFEWQPFVYANAALKELGDDCVK
jgi:uncharacterized small protein (DUF1192 family)